MKKKITLCLVLSMSLLLLFAGGCNRNVDKDTDTDGNNTPGEKLPGDNTDDTNTGDNTDDTNKGKETANDHMTTLRGLIGKADNKLVEAFGEGEAVLEDTLTTGRRYTMNVLGEEMPVHVLLDKKGNVISADASLPDVDEERWNKALTEAFGDPKTANGTTATEDNRSQWIKDGTIYAIEKANDKLALRITGEKAVG